MSTNRHYPPNGRLSPSAANGARSLLATITFLGEQQDITDPEEVVLVGGQTMECPCSVRQKLDSQQPLGAEDAVDSHLGKVMHLVNEIPFSPLACCSVHRVFISSTQSAAVVVRSTS